MTECYDWDWVDGIVRGAIKRGFVLVGFEMTRPPCEVIPQDDKNWIQREPGDEIYVNFRLEKVRGEWAE